MLKLLAGAWKLQDTLQQQKGAICHKLWTMFNNFGTIFLFNLGLSRSISVHLCLSWFISKYLDLFWFIMVYFWLYWVILGYRGLNSVILGYLELNRTILGNLKLSWSIMSYLGYLWQSLGISGYLWLSLAILYYRYWISNIIGEVQVGESKLLLFETLFFTTDTSYRGVRASKNAA